MQTIPDITDNETWIIRTTLRERYNQEVELQLADSEIRLRPSDRELSACPVWYWQWDGCHFVIFKTGDKNYRSQFFYKPIVNTAPGSTSIPISPSVRFRCCRPRPTLKRRSGATSKSATARPAKKSLLKPTERKIESMTKKNAFYAQSGGVTAVINSSACGVIETARKHADKIGTVYAGRNGIIGALTEELIDTSQESDEAISALRNTPSGAFGSCRFKLKSLEQNRREYERLIEVFKAHNIGYFFYNGGGDSADTCYKVSQLSEKMGFPVQAIHVPKTVDNDLPITDNCPASVRSPNTSPSPPWRPVSMCAPWPPPPQRFSLSR